MYVKHGALFWVKILRLPFERLHVWLLPFGIAGATDVENVICMYMWFKMLLSAIFSIHVDNAVRDGKCIVGGLCSCTSESVVHGV